MVGGSTTRRFAGLDVAASAAAVRSEAEDEGVARAIRPGAPVNSHRRHSYLVLMGTRTEIGDRRFCTTKRAPGMPRNLHTSEFLTHDTSIG